MAVQGHPKSFILAPIESTYATSYEYIVINSNLGPILHHFWHGTSKSQTDGQTDDLR